MDIYIDAKRIRGQESDVRKTVVGVKLVGRDVYGGVFDLEYTANNIEAKYLALIKALEIIEETCTESSDVQLVVIYSDCWMMVNQYTGKSDVKEPKLLRFRNMVDELTGNMSVKVEVRYVPREENQARSILPKEPRDRRSVV